MKTSVAAIVVGVLNVSAAHAATFVVEVRGVVSDVFGTGGDQLASAQVGDDVRETFVFDTERLPLTTGDGATFLSYLNEYSSPTQAVRSRVTVGGLSFDVDGYPFLLEGAIAYDSQVLTLPPGFPPQPPTDRFAVVDASATAALNVAGASGHARWAVFGAEAPGASSLVSVPITDLTQVRLTEAAAFTSTLIEGTGSNVPTGGVAFGSGDARSVSVTVQSATLQRCEHRLRWLDADLPWPKHGAGCKAEEEDDDRDHGHNHKHNDKHDHDRNRDRGHDRD